MEEIWKDIQGYNGIYQVSNIGRVRSLDRYDIDKLDRKCFYKGQILKQYYDTGGYLKVNLYKNKKGKSYPVHKLVALAFIPNPENKPQIDHINTIRDDNRIENLRWVTPKENSNNPLTLQHSSEAVKGDKNPFYGKTHTEETRQKLRENHADTSGENNGMFGRTHTPEVKQKLSELGKEKFGGSKNPKAHFTEEQVKTIRAMYEKGWKIPQIVYELYGVTNASDRKEYRRKHGWISDIVKYRTWKHIA